MNKILVIDDDRKLCALIRRYTMFNQNGNDAKTLTYDGLMINLMVLISRLIICLVPYSYERETQSNKKVNVKKQNS